jgi:hypothetical protein
VLEPYQWLVTEHRGQTFLVVDSFPKRVNARTGQISVYAGTAFEGYGGDRGPATSAKIDACGMALD